MNEQEVTEAAERVRRVMSARRGIDVLREIYSASDHQSNLECYADDLEEIVLAHLASQRAAEEEGAKLVDREFLLSLGFIDEDEQDGDDSMMLVFDDCCGSKSKFVIEFESAMWFGVVSITHRPDSHYRLAAITTRGQLTALLAALKGQT